MIKDELLKTAGLLYSSPIGPDSHKLDELLAGLKAERSRLGKRKYVVVLYQQDFDMDGLTDYIYLLDSFDDRSEAIAFVDSNARNLLAVQTAQPDSGGYRWFLERKGGVRILPNVRSGSWKIESTKDLQSNPRANRKLHTRHARTYKIRATQLDTKYNCFCVIGPFADFVVCKKLFDFIDSKSELWWHFVEVGEAIRAGKPRPVPKGGIILPDIKIQPEEMLAISRLLSCCDSLAQIVFITLMENWGRSGFVVATTQRSIVLDAKTTRIAVLIPGVASDKRPAAIVLSWDNLRKQKQFSSDALDTYQKTVRGIAPLHVTPSSAHIRLHTSFTLAQAKRLFQAMKNLADCIRPELAERPPPVRPVTPDNIRSTLILCPPKTQAIFKKLIAGWMGAGGVVQAKQIGRIYLRLKTRAHRSGSAARLPRNFNLLVLAAPKSKVAAHIQATWNLSQSDGGYPEPSSRLYGPHTFLCSVCFPDYLSTVRSTGERRRLPTHVLVHADLAKLGLNQTLMRSIIHFVESRAAMAEFSVEQFEMAGRDNGLRFWFAHEFMTSLGYESWSSFQNVITKAMGSCAKLNIDPTEVFLPATSVEDGKVVKTYKLTRFACFLVSMHADSKKPQVAKAKAVLAAIADQLIEERIQEQDLGRIETREDLKLAERVMSGVAQNAGLENTQFGIFKDAGFRGMYNLGLRELMQQKGVEGNKTLYDFMGLEELAGNLFRVTQTAARIKNQNVRGVTPLSNTAKAVGAEVRGIMIKNSGVAPEALPIEENISSVKNRLKSAAREMKKLDVQKKKRPALAKKEK